MLPCKKSINKINNLWTLQNNRACMVLQWVNSQTGKTKNFIDKLSIDTKLQYYGLFDDKNDINSPQ